MSLKKPTRQKDCLPISNVLASVEHCLTGTDAGPRSCYDESGESGDSHVVNGVGQVEIQGLDLRMGRQLVGQIEDQTRELETGEQRVDCRKSLEHP